MKDFSGLYQVAGLWKMDKKTGALYESWYKENDTLLIGKSFKITSGDTLILENVRLSFQKSTIIYAPVAKGQNNEKEVIFRLKRLKDQQYTFENREHDFPQRIVYHFLSPDSLHASVEGEINGKIEKSAFYYSKVR